MACACHGRKGVVVERKVPPDDQCTTCATKHLNMALAAWGEFTYEDDSRLWAAGHIRLAVEHLKIDHRDLALDLRDLAVAIEEGKDTDRNEIHNRLSSAVRMARSLMLKDHGELAERLTNLESFAPKEEVKTENTKKAATKDSRTVDYIFRTWPHMGDRAAASGALYNLSRAFPDIRWKWASNVDIMFSWHSHMADAPVSDKTKNLTLGYDNTDEVADKGNLVEGYTKYLEKELNLKIPMATHVPYMPHANRYPGLPEEYIVLVAGYEDQCQAKAWPWWPELCRMLVARGAAVVRVGQDKYGQHSLELENAIDLYNKTSESELLSVLAHASCVIGPPTGSVHMASGYGVKCVCIAGAREPARLLDYPNCVHVASYCCGYDANYGCVSFDVTKRNRKPCMDTVEYPCGWTCSKCMGMCPPEVVCAAALGDPAPEGWDIIVMDGMRIYEPVDIANKHQIERSKIKLEYVMPAGRDKLEESKSDEKVDIIIPLGNGSVDRKDEELKIMLRSVDKNLANVGRVFLATKYAPMWLDTDNVIVEDIEDIGCKDAALINKVLTVIDKHGMDGKFIFAADDNVILQPMSAPDIINLSGKWGLRNMIRPTSTWVQRLMKTLRFFRDRGELWPYEYSFETHTPQIFDAAKLKEAIKGLNYADNCFTITTFFRGLLGDTQEFTDAGKFKWTFYKTPSKDDLSKLTERWFLGYNDDGFRGGLRDRLFELFPDKSKYEK